jgi:uncharacterized protein with ParB-like and HNH nuclease domain
MATVDIGIHNIRTTNIWQLLGEGPFQVPFFQREYSWTKDHWADFLEDVREALQKRRGHFFGFMTLKKTADGDCEIIEGQQRMTTVILFLCAIRDLCYELNLEKTQNKITSFISKSSMVESHLPTTPVLTLSRINKEFFKPFVKDIKHFNQREKEFKSKSTVPSNKLIFNCYSYFHTNLSKEIDGIELNEKDKTLESLAGAALEYLIVVTTEVSDHLVAYSMFQTINDRGLDLALSDLLKLHLCTTVKKGKEFIQDYWDGVRDQLVSGNMNNFLRHYWLSSREVVREPVLLDEIRQHIKDEEASYKFMENLSDEVETYEALLKPTKEFWDAKHTDLLGLLMDLQILSPTIPLPLLMAAFNLDVKEFKNVIRDCTTFIFRYLTIGEQESKELEKVFSDLAIDIRKKEIIKASQVRERLLKLDLPEKHFEAALETKDIKLNKVATYILRKIEQKLDPDQEKFSNKITLEHILPKTPDEEWNKYLKENNMDHTNLVHKLGNQTLLLGKVNTKIKNQMFTKKTGEYKKSSKLMINKDLGNLKSWTEKDITQRQKWLTKQCMDIWKL